MLAANSAREYSLEATLAEALENGPRKVAASFRQKVSSRLKALDEEGQELAALAASAVG